MEYVILKQHAKAEEELKAQAFLEAQQELREIEALPVPQATTESLKDLVLEKCSSVVRTLGTYTIPFYDLYLEGIESLQQDKPMDRGSVFQKLKNGTLDLGLMFLFPGFKWVKGGAQAATKVATGTIGKAANSNVLRPQILKNHRIGKQFEAHLGKMFEGVEMETQVSFKNGIRVKPGTKGSSIPDLLLDIGGQQIAIEAKCPVVPTTRNQLRMADRTGKQILKASKNLPQSVKQRVYIDNRTQGITQEVKKMMQGRINKGSKNVMSVDDIFFVEH